MSNEQRARSASLTRFAPPSASPLPARWLCQPPPAPPGLDRQLGITIRLPGQPIACSSRSSTVRALLVGRVHVRARTRACAATRASIDGLWPVGQTASLTDYEPCFASLFGLYFSSSRGLRPLSAAGSATSPLQRLCRGLCRPAARLLLGSTRACSLVSEQLLLEPQQLLRAEDFGRL